MRRAVVWRSPASSELPQTNSGYAAAPYQTVTWPSLASFFTRMSQNGPGNRPFRRYSPDRRKPAVGTGSTLHKLICRNKAFGRPFRGWRQVTKSRKLVRRNRRKSRPFRR
jgi:hypothetical protein